MKQEIEMWLAGDQNYAEGVAIYMKYSRRDNWKRALQKETAYTRMKLPGCLRDLLAEEQTTAVSVRTVGMPKLYDPQVGNRKQRDRLHTELTEEQIQVLEQQQDTSAAIRKAYNARAKLSNSLASFEEGDNTGRLEVVKQIEALTAEIRMLRGTAHVQKHLVPEIKNIEKANTNVPEEGVAIMRKIASARSGISNMKNKLRAIPAGTAAAAAIEQKLTEKEMLLSELLKKIGK